MPKDIELKILKNQWIKYKFYFDLRTYRCLLDGCEHAGGFDDVFGTGLRPRNRLRFALAEDGYLISIDNQAVIFGLDFSLELAVSGVILEHVDHVIETDERIIDGDNLIDREFSD